MGIDISFLNDKIDVIADFFTEHRTNILQPRADVPSTMGLWAVPTTNVGKAKGYGTDISIDYNHSFSNDLWLIARGNFTFARTEYEFYEEPDYSNEPWLSRVGLPISQRWGYYAERLFIDEADVANSPRQDFGEYGAGDLKYKDINKDGVINELDRVPLGYPTIPEINYGFGFTVGYKNIDLSAFFQGSGNSSFWIDSQGMSPFIRSTSSGQITETGLAKFIADDYWSETTQKPHAAWPRLSNREIRNNTQRNSWFMQNGEFLRLKSVELGYSLPTSAINFLRIEALRLYLSGTNLFLFSNFKLWDVELGGNGLNYPIQRTLNLGINLSF